MAGEWSRFGNVPQPGCYEFIGGPCHGFFAPVEKHLLLQPFIEVDIPGTAKAKYRFQDGKFQYVAEYVYECIGGSHDGEKVVFPCEFTEGKAVAMTMRLANPDGTQRQTDKREVYQVVNGKFVFQAT